MYKITSGNLKTIKQTDENFQLFAPVSHFFHIFFTKKECNESSFTGKYKQMKKATTLLFLFCSIVSFSQQEVLINTKASIVNWKGSMLFSFGGHHGTVNFKDGKIIKTNDKITGGNFTVDMTSLINTDGDYSEDLVKHLKDEDFFNVKKYPTSKLVITRVEYQNNGQLKMHANLSIKGITKSVLFEAKLNSDSTKLEAKFKIDRTDWNILYGAKGVVKVKDYAISDAIEFDVIVFFGEDKC